MNTMKLHLQGMGATQGGAMGDIPGVRFKVFKVNGTSLHELSKIGKERKTKEIKLAQHKESVII